MNNLIKNIDNLILKCYDISTIFTEVRNAAVFVLVTLHSYETFTEFFVAAILKVHEINFYYYLHLIKIKMLWIFL